MALDPNLMESSRIPLRLLGVAHVVVAVVLLPSAVFLGLFSIPLVTPGVVWLAILGVRLWWPTERLRTLLRYTHVGLLLFAMLLVAYGLFALRAARTSAEAGGGLLGAVGLIPLVMWLLAGSLSIVSLGVSYSAKNRYATY